MSGLFDQNRMMLTKYKISCLGYFQWKFEFVILLGVKGFVDGQVSDVWRKDCFLNQ